MSSLTLTDIKKEHIQFLKSKDWDRQHTPSMVVVSLVTELGELLEHLLWKKDYEIIAYAKDHADELGEELADVLMNIVELSHRLNVDLPQSVEKKLQKNKKKYKDAMWNGNMAKNHKSSFS